MKILFHGTQVGGIKLLKPNVSLEFVSRVYATEDIAYAYVRAGKQLDEIREEYYGSSEPFELAECYPDAFKHQFNCGGYIYLLNSEDFDYNPLTTEWTSDKAVKPIGCVHIENIWHDMTKILDRYRLIFDGNEEYWTTIRGGREGYLQRKLANKQKMLEMRKELR